VSQAGVTSLRTGGGATTETLTGNSGGAVSPDASFNINIVGNNTSGINIVGVPAANTLTVVAYQGTTTQQGTLTLATNAETIAGTDTAKAITPDDLKAKLGTQTAHGVLVAEGTSSALTALAVGTNGQVLLGSTGADPVFATLTSSDSSISFTTGAGTLSLQVAGGTTVGKTITGNSGGALSPTAGNWNILGTGSITTSGSGSTLTTQLTGLTNHSLLVGAGTATITNLGVATDGQLPIGSTGANPVLATLTGGTGITVTNGAGSISLAVAASVPLSFAGDSGTATPAANSISFNATPTSGSTVAFTGSGSTVSLNVTNSSNFNTLIGLLAGNASPSGTGNTCVGYDSLFALSSGGSNTALGFASLASLQTTSSNTAIGYQALQNITTGAFNIALGYTAGNSYTVANSSNISIGNTGSAGESNAIRIGTNGSGSGQQNKCFIAGIDGVNVGSVAKVVTEASNQLGTATITAGTGISVTPGANTITIASTVTGDVVGPAGATSTAIAVYNGTTGKLIANSIPTIDSSGNILTSASLSGATLSIGVVNSSNTASSTARMSTTVAGGTAADALYQASISGGQVWTFGLDNSDSDAFALASSVSLGTTNVIRASTAGEINYPLQPAFLAVNASTLNNKTGSGGVYTLGTDALTEIYDQNADFNTNGTFTAPVSGVYDLQLAVLCSGITIAATTIDIRIQTSNRQYLTQNASTTIANGAGNAGLVLCALADMDAADTSIFTVIVSGEAGATVDIYGSTSFPGTYICGNLVC
jgi:hypothetical protein